MQIKRLAALSLAAVLTAAMLTGCDLLAWLAWLEENSDSSSVTSSSSSSSSTSRPSYDDDDDAETPDEPDEPDPENPETWPVSEDGTTLIVPSGATSNQITKDLLATHPGITSLDLRNSGLTSIGNWAFGYCTGLASVTLPSGLQSIGQYAFYDCDSLTSITLPGSLTNIGENAFCNCDNLTSVTLPEGLTNLGDGTFSGCTGLTSVTLPEGLTSIGNDAFRKCTSLTSIRVGTGFLDAEIGMNAFVGVGNPHPDDVTVYYPIELDENLFALKEKLRNAGLNTNDYKLDGEMLQAAPAAPNGVKELLDTARLFEL